MENTEQEIKDTVTISPDQLSMLDATDANPADTHLEIGHASVETPTEEMEKDESADNNTKYKVLAALAVVAVAGYIAYWVQEPVQLKADLLDGSSVTSEAAPGGEATDTTVEDTSVKETPAKDAVASENAGPSKSIDISLFGFEPAALQVDKGTTVIWTNTSAEDQTLIGASKNGDSFTSPVMTSGATFTKKFDKDGEYTYYSTYNPALKATINVGMGANVVEEKTDLVAANESILPTPADTMTGNKDNSAIAAEDLKGAALEKLDSIETMTTLETVKDDLKPAAIDGKQHLAKTGPEDYLYLVLLSVIAYFNRRKLAAVFGK